LVEDEVRQHQSLDTANGSGAILKGDNNETQGDILSYSLRRVQLRLEEDALGNSLAAGTTIDDE